MRRLLFSVVLFTGFLWEGISVLANFEYGEQLITNPKTNPQVKYVMTFVTSHSQLVPVAVLLFGFGGLYVLTFGIPFHKTKNQIAEENIYEQIVDAHGQGAADGIPINTFFKCGGHKLPNHSIRALDKQLRKIRLSLFPTNEVAMRHHVKFIRRARKVGRPLNTFDEATTAFAEWKQTGTLRAPWEPYPEPTGLQESEIKKNSGLTKPEPRKIDAPTSVKPVFTGVELVQPPSKTAHQIAAWIVDNLKKTTYSGGIKIKEIGMEFIEALTRASDDMDSEETARSVCQILSDPYGDPFDFFELRYGKGAFGGKRLKFLRDARIAGIKTDNDAASYLETQWADKNDLKETMNAEARARFAVIRGFKKT